MLTEGDRGLGHLLAGEWLEKGEARDPLILVEHFERGGDRQRAARWCRQAADEALARNDLPGAIARARRGVALGATGPLRAGLRLDEARAHFWRGEYAMGEETAWDGVACAAEGDALWFDCVGELAAALGQQGRYDEVTTWAATAEQAAPRAGAAEAQVACLLRAAGYLLRAGDDATTEAIFARVEATVGDVARLEPGLGARYRAVQAMRRLRHGDNAGAIDLLQAALASATRTGDTGTMCDLRVSLASVWAELGQLDTAEALLRQTLEQAQTVELHYITTAALIGLGPVLTHSGRLGEARRLAMQALNFARKQGDQRGEGAAQLYLSTISYVAGEHPGSEQRARRAAEIGSPSLRASALAAVARALLAQGRRPEALEQARAAAAELVARAASGRAERYESLVHLVLAEALAATGDAAGARAVVQAAAARLQARAALLANPDWRRSFLTKLPDNARILALAREWGLNEDSRPVRVDAGGGASGLGPQASG